VIVRAKEHAMIIEGRTYLAASLAQRPSLGLSQRDYAAGPGVSQVSQGQYANAIRGHDPISPFAINRLRELPAGLK